jgi:poly(ADP-ribose) glycohydrolase ARH3
MELEQLRSKFRGALLGVAIGDALGAPYEGTPAELMPAIEMEKLLQGARTLSYTDDTHMTLGVAESLVDRRGFDGAHMASVFARNYNAEPWRGYGAGPPQVFRLIERGIPWDQGGTTLFGGTGSFGNGAAMRVAPAALLAFRDLSEVERLARSTSIITHSHELGIEGAVAQACAVALLVQERPGHGLAPYYLLRELRSRPSHPLYYAKLASIEALLSANDRREVIAQIGNGIAAQEAVPAALYSFLKHHNSFAQTVIAAIGLGGDTDTIASMAGALAGAYLGEGAIPEQWSERVEGKDRLRALADELLLLAAGEA